MLTLTSTTPYPVYLPARAANATNATTARLVHFAAQKPVENLETIRAVEDLKRQELPSLISASLLFPFRSLASIVLHPLPLVTPIAYLPSMLVGVYNYFSTLNTRIQFNKHQDLELFPKHMAPYYHHLKQSGDADGLKQYESLVNQLVQRVEFYQTPESQRFHMAFSSHPTMKAASQAWHDYKIATAGSVAEFNRKARQDKTFAKEAKARRLQLFIQAQSSIPRSAVTQILERHTEPLADKATRYAIAANLAELCFRQPERALELLDASRPLRVLAHKDFISGDIGNFNAGINLIEVSTPQLWMARPYATIAQHEGVHAMSDQAGLLTKGLLPRMSDRQEKRFIDARSAMRHIYETQDNTLSGRLRFALTGITATGIRPYAFHADYEFLTVTLDTFSRNPKALCKTEPGRELYGIYKALFGIDPLRELYGK